MKNWKKIKESFIILLVSIAVFVVYIFIWVYFLYSNNDFALHFQKIFKIKPNKDLVIIEINDITLKELGYPLERKYIIEVLDKISTYKPAAIWIDILFYEKSSNKNIDTKLFDTFKKLWNIVLWYEVEWKNVKKPYFEDKSIFYWYYNPNIAINNNVYSVYPYRYLYDKKIKWLYESFSFKILRKYYNYNYLQNNTNIKIKENNTPFYNFFNKKIPLDNNHLFNIIFLKNQREFNHESFYDIYKWKKEVDLNGKIVLIWFTSQWIDKFNFPNIWEESWVYFHANIINDILNENYIIYFNIFYEYLISFLLIILILFLNLHLKKRKLWWMIIWWVSLSFFIFLVYILFLYITEIPIFPNNTIWFISIILLSFFASSIIKYMNEDDNKKLLFAALSDYVSSDIANEILNGTWNINLDGEKKRITIFFSDIAWFTTISEKLSPEELVWFLKIYLWNMSDIIKANKWTIDKYEWDAIMAWWWVFWEIEKYGIIDACNSCLLQQMELKRLNEKWKQEWKNELTVRMGLNTWDAIVWNIWSKWKKMEFTALWDSVNLASRLEWVNKFYGTYICVSEDVYNEAKEKFTFRYLDKIRVKWKNIWINIYELISYIWEEWDFKKDIISRFSTAIGFYFEKNFNEAFNIFSALAELWDNPSKTYKSRCERYLVNPPHEDWDGVWVLDEK